MLQLSLAGAGIVGLAAQALAPKLVEWAGDELRDARLVVEKIAGLGAAPNGRPRRLVEILAARRRRRSQP